MALLHIYQSNCCDKSPLVYSLGPIRTLLALFLFCDRPIAGDVRGSGDTAPSSAFKVGSLAEERLSWFPYFRLMFGPEFSSFVPKRRRQRGVLGLRV